jgi:hypothetical protein
MICLARAQLRTEQEVILLAITSVLVPEPIRSLRLIIILLLALQRWVELVLFQNCSPLFSVLLLTSPGPYAHVLYIFLN